jgi:enoyl-CoA hydratase/carnithine racemase
MPEILITDDSAVRTIRMNRPEKKNALTFAMYEAMSDAIEEANRRPDVHCLIIAGHASGFCSGNDLGDFMKMTESGAMGAPIIRFLHALARCEKPLVAAVAGPAAGVGTTMLMHCDYVIASDDARFMTPFVALGLVPEAASSLIAPRLMGHARAFSLLVMGEPLSAEEARMAGLINKVTTSDALDAQALASAQKIAALPLDGVLKTRQLMRGPSEEIIARIDREADLFKQRLKSPEAKAAFAAFLNRKR